LTRYMLDTNIISDLIRNGQSREANRQCWRGQHLHQHHRGSRVALRMRKERLENTAQGRRRLARRDQRAAVDVPADAEYGGIRSVLEAAGKPIGSNDLLIAAHAYATGATIVTANANEFKRIRGLRVENWLA
jgi:tRNA(fMet)-specific endonuclease VapC